MKVRYKAAKVEVEVEGADTKDCFAELSTAIEVFGSSTCGACDSTNTVPVVREVNGVTYHEMRCADCGCSLSFGQTRNGGKLFPKRKDKEGNYLPSNGWTKWTPKDEAF